MKLVVCGDSFACGVGCINMYTQPFGPLVAKHFNWDLITLARGSSSNYGIYLQGTFASTLEPQLVLISLTSYDRVEWVADGKDKYKAKHNFTLHDLNYHQYPPHYEALPHHNSPLEFYTNDDKYNPVILTEQVGAIPDYLDCVKRKVSTNYYKRFHTEPEDKLELIARHYGMCVHPAIKRDYDIGLILQAYTKIKKSGANCIIMTHDKKFKEYFDENDLFEQNWTDLSDRFPDTIGSRHTSELGHKDTADRLIQFITEHGHCN